ncbi:TIGR02449 family protein [Halorhodospira abdelmalekii]|uniref:TIGR02449 family protein n=1 Tax=Halorhodospira abdelmalekii TaxID=421629 RepID=UPI001904A526|nr:TIGR02449 family protein [Halorhodospira abdelmalekii]
MSDNSIEELARLEQRIDRLVHECVRLREENHRLRQSQEQLAADRATLHEKNEHARAQIEAMISRLKAMEQ